jgi:transposase-like protein
MKEDAESWKSFIKGILARGLKGVGLVTGDRCAGLVASVSGLLPGARYQRVHGALRTQPPPQGQPQQPRLGGRRTEGIFSMETGDKALEKAESVAKEMEARKLKEATSCLRERIDETTTYLLDDYPREHR